MKRGGALKRHVRLARVSAKVKAGKPEYDAVYRRVDERSGGRCEVSLATAAMREAAREILGPIISVEPWRCTARAVEHHHTRKPRRVFHQAEWIIHICRRHHDDVSATFQHGRLYTEPQGQGVFTCYYRFKPENPFK